jgi:putative intracellular protease/amidase
MGTTYASADSMKTIYFFITDTLADWEGAHVLSELCSGRYLKDPGQKYNLVLCGRTMDSITTMGGFHLTPDLLITAIRPVAGDLVLLPGADTWLNPEQAPVIDKVREILNSGITVAAICGATFALANAGLLDNRPHTSNDLAVLKMFCPAYHGEEFYVNEPAVTDGNLITASGLAPLEFAYHILGKLDVMTPRTLDAWHELVTTRKPECFFELMESLPKKAGPY